MRLLCTTAIAVTTVACSAAREIPPLPKSPFDQTSRSRVEIIEDAAATRPPCTSDVRSALETGTPEAVTQAARGGSVFTCRLPDGRLPLDQAIWADDAGLVRALLEAKADPNARWSRHGDRFPLEEAVELRQFGRPGLHRFEMIRLLLDHGADPNQRWCPYEARRAVPGGACVSEGGITALHWAAIMGDGALAVQLLGAGADPAIEDQSGANPLDLAQTEGVFYPLLQALDPEVTSHSQQAVAHLDARPTWSRVSGPLNAPSQQTALSRAITGWRSEAAWFLPPPPPPLLTRYAHVSRSSSVVGRVRALLALGADPNRRLSWGGVDWTPLALAIGQRDAEVVVALLGHGADVDARWCVPVGASADARWRPAPGCAPDSGITPLHYAADLGEVDVIRALLIARPDPTLRDSRGQTALDVARARRHGTVLADLQAYAADHRGNGR